jgi:hypothetical protein
LRCSTTRVEVPPARARRRAEELDVLVEERDHDELARDVVGALARAVQQVAAWPPALALRWGEEQQLHATMPLGPVDLHPYAARIGPPAHELGVVVRAR